MPAVIEPHPSRPRVRAGVARRFGAAWLACALAAPSPAGASTVQDETDRSRTAESVVSLLATYLAGLPRGRFEFEVNERSFAPPAEWRERAAAQFARCIAVERDRGPAAGVDVAPADWELFADQHVAFLESSVLADARVRRGFEYEFGPDFVEFRAEMQPSAALQGTVDAAWMTVLYTDDERLQVIALRPKPDAFEPPPKRQAQRTAREVQDVERADNTHWLIHSRRFVRSWVESLRSLAAAWNCERDGADVVARWTIDEPGEWPNFPFHQGLIAGVLELRIDGTTGAPRTFECRDSTGELVQRVRFADYHDDGRNRLPLSIELETWYVGTGQPRNVVTLRGTSTTPRGRSSYAELVPAGTHVTDARFHPPVSYVEGLVPLDDAAVMELSSHVAENEGREQRTDLHLSSEPAQPPTRDAPPSERSNVRMYVGLALLVAGVGWLLVRLSAPGRRGA